MMNDGIINNKEVGAINNKAGEINSHNKIGEIKALSKDGAINNRVGEINNHSKIGEINSKAGEINNHNKIGEIRALSRVGEINSNRVGVINSNRVGVIKVHHQIGQIMVGVQMVLRVVIRVGDSIE